MSDKKPAIVFTKSLTIRVRPEELDRWRKASETGGRTLSHWMRFVLNREAKK